MNSLNRARTLHTALPLLVLALPISSCGAGAAAEAIRPDAPTANKVLEEGECRGVDKGGEPLIVDWKPNQRDDLEVAMKDGIAIVAYSCESIKILADCKLDGDYGFIGMTRREQVVRLANADEVRANLPLSGAKIGGEMQRGMTLDIAMMTVGKKRTTWGTPSKDELKGSCDGATHFVRGATVGAFAMTSGTDAKVRAAAEIFGASTEAASSSSKETQNRDGDVADCKSASPDAEKAPAQCGAPIRLVLSPLGKAGAGAAAEAEKPKGVEQSEKSTCPAGMVFADGKCTTAATAAAYECDPKNAAECKTQCEKGNPASCGILGEQHAEKGEYPAAAELLKKGCDGNHMRACANLGKLKALGLGMTQDIASAIPLFEKACQGGDPVGCKELGRAYLFGNAPLTKDEAKAANLFRQACDGGDNQACSFYASLLEEGKGTAKDVAKAAQLYKRACDGGLAAACADAGKFYETGVSKNPIMAQILYQRGCVRAHGPSCSGLGRTQLALQPDSAKRSFEQACNWRDQFGCAASKVLFGTNRPVVPDVRALNALGDKCRQGSTGDCAASGLLEVARGNAVAGKMNLQNACGRGDAFACAVMKKVK